MALHNFLNSAGMDLKAEAASLPEDNDKGEVKKDTINKKKQIYNNERQTQ